MKTNIPETELPRVVIIGGGFAGLKLAQRLKDEPVQVVLLDKNNYHTFQPLLYQAATGGLEADSIVHPFRSIFKGYSNLIFRMARAEQVDTAKSELTTSVGTISYDYLVIATGSKTNYYGLDEVKKNAKPMKSIRQALNLRSFILQNLEQALLTADEESREELMNFVVVGGGPTGVELAGALAELKKHVLPADYPELDLKKMQIHLLEASPRLLGGMSEKSSHKALNFLNEMGINVWLRAQVRNYDGKMVLFNENDEIRTKNLIWTAGVTGAPVQGIPAASVLPNGRVKVNAYNCIEGLQNIFAVGDIAFMSTADYPKGHPMMAPVAVQQGKNLAENIIRNIRGKAMQPFLYRNRGAMATIGRNKAVAEVFGLKLSGTLAWFIWMLVHLLSLVGFRNKLVIFLDWSWNYFSYDKALRLITTAVKTATPLISKNEAKELRTAKI